MKTKIFRILFWSHIGFFILFMITIRILTLMGIQSTNDFVQILAASYLGLWLTMAVIIYNLPLFDRIWHITWYRSKCMKMRLEYNALQYDQLFVTWDQAKFSTIHWRYLGNHWFIKIKEEKYSHEKTPN